MDHTVPKEEMHNFFIDSSDDEEALHATIEKSIYSNQLSQKEIQDIILAEIPDVRNPERLSTIALNFSKKMLPTGKNIIASMEDITDPSKLAWCGSFIIKYMNRIKTQYLNRLKEEEERRKRLLEIYSDMKSMKFLKKLRDESERDICKEFAKIHEDCLSLAYLTNQEEFLKITEIKFSAKILKTNNEEMKLETISRLLCLRATTAEHKDPDYKQKLLQKKAEEEYSKFVARQKNLYYAGFCESPYEDPESPQIKPTKQTIRTEYLGRVKNADDILNKEYYHQEIQDNSYVKITQEVSDEEAQRISDIKLKIEKEIEAKKRLKKRQEAKKLSKPKYDPKNKKKK